MKKRIIPLFLAAFLLSGCGMDSTPEQITEPVVTTVVITSASTLTTASTTTNSSETSAKTKTSTAAETTAETTTSAENRVLSDGSKTEQDEFKTDPVPEGMPLPVEPQEAEINEEKKLTCTLSIDCLTILENIDSLDEDKVDILPKDGYILPPVEIEFSEGESVFDVLKRVCMENKIHMEFSWTPVYNSAYIEGIGNLYEFDCGALSGWMYSVNGWFPNYGCSRYQLTDRERVEWRYTCDLGNDVGGGNAVGGT